ncbi:MAG: amidase family protein [Acidobacteriota bacterium]|nr:amidase family protein [Acidobacteriota bacterium]
MICIRMQRSAAYLAVGVALVVPAPARGQAAKPKFDVMEATVEQIHAAMREHRLTAHELVQDYLDRIQAYNTTINCVIATNNQALADADKLDAEFKSTGHLAGSLHGIPVLIKDQVDVANMPTTLGSVLFKDYVPPTDSVVVAKLRGQGAIILGKATLGEFGGGDAFGSGFGVTHNPYDLDRTVGGSSGGSGACLSANLSTLALGEEGFASIRRPSAWNSTVGMRPTPGLVTRTGIYAGWPEKTGQLGPMARTVADMAKMLDAMVGYDPADPLTALGVGNVPSVSYATFLKKDGLKGARIGIIRESMGDHSEPDTDDYKKVDVVFEHAVGELKAAGAVVIDPLPTLNIKEALAARANAPGEAEESFENWVSRNPSTPYHSLEDVKKNPDVVKILPYTKEQTWEKPAPPPDPAKYARFIVARDKLAYQLWNLMAENRLDAIVFKTVEHQPTLIKDGLNPPYYNQRGVTSINTFLIHAAALSVPAGFTTDNLPVGITFFSRPFSEPTLLKLAYSYEQTTHHRVAPKSTPALSSVKAAVATESHSLAGAGAP